MLNAYSPKDVSVSFNGIAITGFNPDSFIRAKRNAESLKETVGVAGEVSLTKIADKTGEIEVELLQTSESNLHLAALLAAQELSGGLIPVGELIILDESGSIPILAHNAYLKKPPEMDLGADQNSRTWTFGCESLIYTPVPSGYQPDFKGFTL